MQADSYHKMGNSHIYCQDSSAHCVSEDGNHAIAVISDGCSSVEWSQLHSSEICQTLLYEFKTCFDQNIDYKIQYFKIMLSRAINGNNSGMATLCAAIVDKAANQVSFVIKGDGIFGYQTKTGDLKIYSVEFSENAPEYLGYKHSENSYEVYEQLCKQKIKIMDLLNEKESELKYEIGFNNPNLNVYTFDLDDLDFVFVGSDGLLTPSSIVGQKPLKDSLEEFLRFAPGAKGQFVKRRMINGISRYFDQGFEDDISLSVIKIN
jgi:serine/threonine protein phosphatase PrpC